VLLRCPTHGVLGNFEKMFVRYIGAVETFVANADEQGEDVVHRAAAQGDGPGKAGKCVVPGAVGNASWELKGNRVAASGFREEPGERVVMLFEHKRGIVEYATGNGEVSGPGIDLNCAVTKRKAGLGGGSPDDEGLESIAGRGDLKVGIAEALNDGTGPWFGRKIREAVVEIDARIGVVVRENVSDP